MIENKTDGDIHFTTSNAKFDSVPWIIYNGDDVISAGLTAAESTYVDAMEVEQNLEVDFKEIKEITFTAWVLDTDTFTEKTFRDMEWSWRMSTNGDTSVFNPETYALAKEEVVLEIKDFDYGW